MLVISVSEATKQGPPGGGHSEWAGRDLGLRSAPCLSDPAAAEGPGVANRAPGFLERSKSQVSQVPRAKDFPQVETRFPEASKTNSHKQMSGRSGPAAGQLGTDARLGVAGAQRTPGALTRRPVGPLLPQHPKLPRQPPSGYSLTPQVAAGWARGLLGLIGTLGGWHILEGGLLGWHHVRTRCPGRGHRPRGHRTRLACQAA